MKLMLIRQIKSGTRLREEANTLRLIWIRLGLIGAHLVKTGTDWN